jgi:hypothetical protein
MSGRKLIAAARGRLPSSARKRDNLVGERQEHDRGAHRSASGDDLGESREPVDRPPNGHYLEEVGDPQLTMKRPKAQKKPE